MASLEQRLMRVERRRSVAALWSRRLAVFAVPYLAIVVLGHRFGAIQTPPTFWLLALGGGILGFAVILGIRGFHELWTTGAKGGMNSLRGTALACLLLLPFGWSGYQALVLPALHDVSTDLENPPEFASAIDDRSVGMNTITQPSQAAREQQLLAYPQIAARRYPLGSSRVLRAALSLMAERNWTLLTSETVQGQAPIDEVDSGLLARPNIGPDGNLLRTPSPQFRPQDGALDEVELAGNLNEIVGPTGRELSAEEALEERYLEAIATSFFFGFESDVVIRLAEKEDGTLVDMRAASRWGPHDLGSNAALIRDFMEDLDEALQGEEG